MEIKIPKGKYVLAVSGGVDSTTLLHLLAKRPGIELVVAHFNHGIRPDASQDEELVRKAAQQLGLASETGFGHLGAGTNEETARKARYSFLKSLRTRYQTKAIVTAHHQDDLIETAILNLLRGTGRKGLVAISANKKIVRPLLGYSKQRILEYAKKNNLIWREDPTNLDNNYLRNRVRNAILPKLTIEQREAILLNIDKVAKIESILNPEIAKLSRNIYHNAAIDRAEFGKLPIDLGKELIVYWLRRANFRDYDKPTINRLNMALRTYKAGTICPVKDNIELRIDRRSAHFSHTL